MGKFETETQTDTGATRRRAERGVGVLEMVIVLSLISVVTAFAVVGVTRARGAIRLQNSMRQLAGNVEKARIDAIRRHGSAKVEFTSSSSYTLTMDFDGTGNDDNQRTYSLENNVTITNADGTAIAAADLPIIDFDWRGRTTQCFTSVRMQNPYGETSSLAVTSSGDITVNSNVGATVSPGTYSNVNQTTDVASSATVSGATPASATNPCGAAPVAVTPPPSSAPPGCSAFTLDTSLVTIRRNGGSTAAFTATATTLADVIRVYQSDGRTNLEFLPAASQSVSAGGTKTYTVRSRNNSKGLFPIKFVSACSASNVISATVSVTN